MPSIIYYYIDFMQKKYIVLATLWLCLIVYVWYSKFFSPTTVSGIWKESYSIVQVEKKDFSSTISLNGTTKIKNEQKLRFNTAGKVVDVYVSAGQNVKKGQPLAMIDSTRALGNIEKAELSLQSSRVKLQKFLDTLEDSGIKNARLDVEIKKSQIAQKQIELDYLESKQNNELKQKQIELKRAVSDHKILKEEVEKNIASYEMTDEKKQELLKAKELELEKSELEYKQFLANYDATLRKNINTYENLLENEYYNLQSNLSTFESQLKQANVILGIKAREFKYSDLFSAKDVNHKQKARVYYGDALWKFEQLENLFKTIKNKKDASNIITTLESQKELLSALYNLFDALSQGFENSLASSNFTQWTIDSYASSFWWMRSSAQSRLTSISQSIDTLSTNDSPEKIALDLERDKLQQENAIRSLRLDIKNVDTDQSFLVKTVNYNIENEKLKEEKSKITLSQYINEIEQFKKNQSEQAKQARAEKEKLELDLITLEKSLENLLKLSDNQEYVFLKNDVKQNNVSLKDARKELENYSLEAPFDGIVTKVEIAKGDRLNADTQKFISIVDPKTIEVKTFVSQTDIVKIKTAMPVNMNLDAYTEETFSGSISEIETTPTDQNWISKFEVKILLENPKDLKLYSGMKAEIRIPTKNLWNVIVVPFISVSHDEVTGEKFVTKVLESGETKRQVVEVGYTNGEYYEILSWLQEGDKVYEIDYNPDLFKQDTFSDEESF